MAPSQDLNVPLPNAQTPPHILTLVLIAGLGALNMNIFLPSLPSMAAYFQTDYAVMQLAVSAYLGLTAVMQIIIGPLSDLYGRRPVLIGGLLVFLVATLGCMLSTSVEVFLAFRLVQASVVTGMALSRAIVRDLFDQTRAASMLGYVTMGMAVVPMIGPSVGGVLQQAFGWQATFAALLVFGILVTALVVLDLGETNTHKSASLKAQAQAYPELLRSRRFWGYTATASFASGTFFAFLGGGPYVASAILGMSPARLGLYFGLIAMGYFIGNFLSGRYTEQVGVLRMMVTGSLIALSGTVLATALFMVGLDQPLSLFGPICLVGVGNGLTMPSANAGIVSVRPHLAGSASGLGGALMIGGGAAIAALTGMLLGEGSSAYPLLLMMVATSFVGVFAALYVRRLEEVLGAPA